MVNQVSSVHEEFFTPLSHYGPVTALKFHGNYVFCGYGPIFKVFDLVEKKLVESHQIFARNKIHSISVSKDGQKIMVAGARSFAVFNHSQNLDSVVEKAVNEWITSAEFLDNETALILTSHNIVYKVDVSDMVNLKFILTERIHCHEKSILYSGSIRVGKDKVIIASGTVMDGTIIWDLNSRQILHRLTEHKGSIFGVKIDENFKHIVSCSDDRSVKLYDFETGALLAEGWGHGARIWNLEFYRKSENVRIISSSEDCTARLWEYNENGLVQLEVIDDCHLGKHVWSCDIDDLHYNLAVTGGADGRVRLHNLFEADNKPDCHSLEQISSQAGIQIGKNEVIKSMKEIPSINCLLAVTTHGRILRHCFDSNTWSTIELEEEERLKFVDFAMIEVISCSRTVIITSLLGDMLILTLEKDIESVKKCWISATEGNKVNNLIVASDPEEKTFYVLLDSPNTRVPFYVKKFELENGELTLAEELTLKQPDQPKFTSTSIIYDSINHWLIVCSRFVSIMVYDLNTMSGTLFKKICPGDTITSSSVIENKKGSIHFLAVIRDGAYMYLKLTKPGDFKLEITHENKITSGFIEGGYIKNNDLILYGFRSNYFYIWNETKQLEITKELCGGAHRLWLLSEKDNIHRFIYINKYKLYVKTFEDIFDNYTYGLINDGTHGREIRDVAIAPSLKDGSKLIMTGSEDTILRLGKLHPSGEVKYYWCLNSHISGLQRVKFLSDSFAASSAAMEEFIIWELSSLDNGTPLIHEYARLKPGSEFPDLRVMDFDAYETETGFVITTIYSDSHIKVWDFNTQDKKFTLLVEDFYTTCCLLNVQYLDLGGDKYLLVAATDGHIAIWKLDFRTENKKLGKPIIKQQIHQNSIKSFAIDYKSEKECYLITGGDDNALVLSRIYLKEDIIWETISFIEDGASSTITSVEPAGNNQVVVISVDQIVRVWDYSTKELLCKSARYTTVADTGCAETTTFNNKNIVAIGGAGLSIWSW